MGGQLGRSIPGYYTVSVRLYPGILSVCEVVCMGGQVGRIPSIGIPSIPGTVSVRGYVWGTTREDPEDPRILSIPDTVSVRLYVWGDNSGGSQVSRDT